MTTSFRLELPNPPNAQRVPLGTFRNFARNHANANAHARSVRKSLVQLSATRRQVAACFCTAESAVTYSEIFRFPHSFCGTFLRTFRKVSAGLSAQSFRRTFPTKFPLDFPQGLRTDACRELLPKSLRIQCLWLGLEEEKCPADPVP